MNMKLNTEITESKKRPVYYHLGVGAISLLCLTTFLIIANIAKEAKLISFDTVIRDLFIAETESFVFQLFGVITWFGTTPGVIIFLIVMFGVLAFVYRDYRGALLLITMVILTNELNKLLKDFFQRERPSINSAIEAIGYSFPSGHAMTGLLAYGLATYLLLNKHKSFKVSLVVGISGAIFILLLGFSRIVLSAHYPTDVLAGHLMGLTLLIFSIYLYQWLRRKEVPRPTK
ncbi:phosphatase PAP2 family protein [Bacillus sp. 2205SS5-2]|uniref:phosphatase PAP2 family protein n=1 Tax=Bacillus sp. 2205SS5-2 TaxID=3109031 RepID=UPI003005C537